MSERSAIRPAGRRRSGRRRAVAPALAARRLREPVDRRLARRGRPPGRDARRLRRRPLPQPGRRRRRGGRRRADPARRPAPVRARRVQLGDPRGRRGRGRVARGRLPSRAPRGDGLRGVELAPAVPAQPVELRDRRAWRAVRCRGPDARRRDARRDRGARAPLGDARRDPGGDRRGRDPRRDDDRGDRHLRGRGRGRTGAMAEPGPDADRRQPGRVPLRPRARDHARQPGLPRALRAGGDQPAGARGDARPPGDGVRAARPGARARDGPWRSRSRSTTDRVASSSSRGATPSRARSTG